MPLPPEIAQMVAGISKKQILKAVGGGLALSTVPHLGAYGVGRLVGKRKARKGIPVSGGGVLTRSALLPFGRAYTIGVMGGLKRHGGRLEFRKRKARKGKK